MLHLALVNELAKAILVGEPALDPVVDRVRQVVARPRFWIRELVGRYFQAFDGRMRPRKREVLRFLSSDAGLELALREQYFHFRPVQWIGEPQRMQPAPAARSWAVPVLESIGALADWLSITPGELEWFADLKELGRKSDNLLLRHFHYRVLAKRFGDVRLIEAPKPHLKRIQRKILYGILEKIPVHPAVHGFLRGRSIQSFAAPHAGRRVVVRMDLKRFFPSITKRRIQSLFLTAGYPENVANLLGGLCTNATPLDAWSGLPPDVDQQLLWESRTVYAQGHLPQGAPTSPALANICAYRLDCRLAGLAGSLGAAYTRYADDLAFSGGDDFARRAGRLAPYVAAILLEEGFSTNHRKTRVMRPGVRQHLAGLVVNQHINVMRPDFERLKATLTNCVRFGPMTQNREAHPCFRSHLEGRVGFVETVNPAKGARLRQILDRIDWA